MEFWSTVRGTRLADTLIRELPKLTGRKKQEVILLQSEKEGKLLREQIKDGRYFYVGSYTDADGLTNVVIEKR